MSNIALLKGVRSKFNNTLETELTKEFIKIDVSIALKIEYLKVLQECKSILGKVIKSNR